MRHLPPGSQWLAITTHGLCLEGRYHQERRGGERRGEESRGKERRGRSPQTDRRTDRRTEPYTDRPTDWRERSERREKAQEPLFISVMHRPCGPKHGKKNAPSPPRFAMACNHDTRPVLRRAVSPGEERRGEGASIGQPVKHDGFEQSERKPS